MLCSSRECTDGRAVMFDSQLVGTGGNIWDCGVPLEVFKYQITDWLDCMTGSEKYSNRVTYIKYKLPHITPWEEAVMRTEHMALTCVLLQNLKLPRDRRTR